MITKIHTNIKKKEKIKKLKKKNEGLKFKMY